MIIVYFDYILSIARLSLYLCISSYSTHSKVPWVSGRHCVSVVLICCLPMETPYILDHVVDRARDTPRMEVHVGCGYEGRQALFLIFLSNIPYV